LISAKQFPENLLQFLLRFALDLYTVFYLLKMKLIYILKSQSVLRIEMASLLKGYF